MKRLESRRPGHAVIVAYLALFVALGGSSYAAAKLSGSQLVNRSVSAKKIKKRTLTGTEVKDGSLKARDFRAGELPSGARGPAGPQGSPGSALAYAYLDGNGALDTANSKNVAGVTLVQVRPPGGEQYSELGRFCFDLTTGPARNVIASPADAPIHSQSVIEVRTYSGAAVAAFSTSSSFSTCPEGYRDASVRVVRNYVNGSLEPMNLPLYAAFN